MNNYQGFTMAGVKQHTLFTGLRPTESGAIHWLQACGQRTAFTMAGAGQRTPLIGLRACGHAFTMAEILLSLTIIGVVAAITLPSLTGNINERTWNTQRKALFSRFSQAVALMPALNGYATVTEESSTGAGDGVDTAAETFITDKLSKVLKINNICDNAHLGDCGLPQKIIRMNGTTSTLPITMKELNDKMVGSLNNGVKSFYIKNTKAAAFETANGESILAFVNPYCTGTLNDIEYGGTQGSLYQRTVCANFVYDLNGKKGPNTVGKDIGVITVMYPSDPVVISPYPAKKILSNISQREGGQACSNYDPDYRLPNLEESYAMFVNRQLLQPNDVANPRFWSSTVQVSPVTKTIVGLGPRFDTGEVDDWGITAEIQAWCVKR